MLSLFEQNTRLDSKTSRLSFNILGDDAACWPSGSITSVQQNFGA